MDDFRSEADLRVLWVSPTIGSRFGGPTTTTINGVIAESRNGLATELVSTIGPDEDSGTSPGAVRLRGTGAQLRLFRRIGASYRSEAWGISPRLAWWLVRNVRRYDVVHLQYVWCLSSIVGAISAKLWRIPLVITPHESLTDFDTEVASRHRLLKLLKRALRHLYLGIADQLVLMSELEDRDTRYGSTPATIISHAVQETESPGNNRSGSQVGRGSPRSLRIAFMGRKVKKKGIHLAIEALVRREDADRHLFAAGPPPLDGYEESLNQLAASISADGRVNWLGFLPDRNDLLHSCDLLVMPSEYEGFGMVAAEAMGAGLPVIVPRNSGVAEIVTEFKAGIVIEESTVEALDEALRTFEDTPGLLEEMGSNGILAANSRLTFAAYANQTKRLYRELASQLEPGMRESARQSR